MRDDVGPEAVVGWVREAMDRGRPPEAAGRARLTLTYIAPDGTETVTEVPFLDLNRLNALATVQHTREMYWDESYDARVAMPPSPVADWYSLLIHAPAVQADGEDHAWTETRTDPVLQFLHRMLEDYHDETTPERIEDWESAGYVMRRLTEIRKEETGWPTPST